MRKVFYLATCVACVALSSNTYARGLWKQLGNRPATNVVKNKSAAFSLDEAAMENMLAPALSGTSVIIPLPTPGGATRMFVVRYTPLLPPALALRYPEIKTWTGICEEDPAITAKLDMTPAGFHGMVYDGSNTSLIDPATGAMPGVYSAHYKRDETRATPPSACLTPAGGEPVQMNTLNTAKRTINGYELRTYRLALLCTHQYAAAATGKTDPTKAETLAKMTTTINRVNGVYEREFSVTMQFADKEDSIIFNAAATDPVGALNDDILSMLDTTQSICDLYIGDGNYDIGHALSTSSQGGFSQVGVVCKAGQKAQSATGSNTPYGDGFDVDYLCHEMGHEFGADHTFNNNSNGGCNGNAVIYNAFEPCSGSTIMAYAGLCQPDNIQPHSDDYFHASSLAQISKYISGDGNVCAAKSPSGNHPPGLTTFSHVYTIPANTPFELTAPTAYDSVGSATTTYCWEEWDLGDFGMSLPNTQQFGPLFRSNPATTSNVRMFPDLSMLRNGILSNAGENNASGEKTPDTSRLMKFRLTARSIVNGNGCFITPDDSIVLNVAYTGATGFSVTSQNKGGISYGGSTRQRVTWEVAGSDKSPVNAGNVDIYVSFDSGYTWPHHVGTFPNNGSAEITIPNPDSTVNAARIKVKGAGNVFFNINLRDFQITRNLGAIIEVSPVPASNSLNITNDSTTTTITAQVFNMAGRKQWEDTFTGSATVDVSTWARGVYVVRLVDKASRCVIRKIVID